MATNVIMPSLGFDMTQGKVARWLKKEGDQVSKGQAVAEVETEKATVEIEAFGSGVLQKILVQAGETVPINTPIAVIVEPGEQTGAATTAPAATSVPQATSPAQPAQPTAQTAPQSTTDRVQEYGPVSSETGVPEQRAQAITGGAATTPIPPPARETGEDGRVKASPVARRMAEEAGVDLRQLKGSGPGGRIMERDVEAAISQFKVAAGAPPPVAPTPAPAPTPTTVSAAPTAGGTVALSRMRQTIAQRMTQSKQTAPHFYVTVEINMTDAMKLREQLNALASDAEKISVNDLVIAAAARTLTHFLRMNSSFHDNALQTHSNINIGVAVAVEDGLLTPVLHDVDKKSLKQIAGEARAMTERTRANKLRPEDLGPSTFTVSNLGMFGVDEFVAIINPPEAAILAVGAVAKRAIVVNDQVTIAPTMRVTLSVDHRVADGAEAARFLQDFKKLLENPVNLLLG